MRGPSTRKFKYLANCCTWHKGGDPGLGFRSSGHSPTGFLPCFLYTSVQILPSQWRWSPFISRNPHSTSVLPHPHPFPNTHQRQKYEYLLVSLFIDLASLPYYNVSSVQAGLSVIFTVVSSKPRTAPGTSPLPNPIWNVWIRTSESSRDLAWMQIQSLG